jgi:hypothetical protein
MKLHTTIELNMNIVHVLTLAGCVVAGLVLEQRPIIETLTSSPPSPIEQAF